MVHCFRAMLHSRGTALDTNNARLLEGLRRLRDTERDVEMLRDELQQMEPALLATSQQAPCAPLDPAPLTRGSLTRPAAALQGPRQPYKARGSLTRPAADS